MSDYSRIRKLRIILILVAPGALCPVVTGLGKGNRLRLFWSH
jgi:hypothetical protein